MPGFIFQSPLQYWDLNVVEFARIPWHAKTCGNSGESHYTKTYYLSKEAGHCYFCDLCVLLRPIRIADLGNCRQGTQGSQEKLNSDRLTLSICKSLFPARLRLDGNRRFVSPADKNMASEILFRNQTHNVCVSTIFNLHGDRL